MQQLISFASDEDDVCFKMGANESGLPVIKIMVDGDWVDVLMSREQWHNAAAFVNIALNFYDNQVNGSITVPAHTNIGEFGKELFSGREK